MEFFTEDKLLTCTLPKGLATEFLEQLKDAPGVCSVDIASGRGIDAYDGDGGEEWVEVDILTAVVSKETAEDNFALVHDLAGIADEPGRFLYMESLKKKVAFGSAEED